MTSGNNQFPENPIKEEAMNKNFEKAKPAQLKKKKKEVKAAAPAVKKGKAK